MTEDSRSHSRILETAWHRFAQLDANAIAEKNRFMNLKRTLAISTVCAVLFAILVDNYSSDVPSWAQIILRVLLIITPIITSIIAAFANKFQQGQHYLAFRAAAEEILKMIYIYRAALKPSMNRDKWLGDQLAIIQRKLFRAVGGELILRQYRGNLPPYYDPSRDYSDPGFSDLSGDEYLAYRLEDQLAWHIKKILKVQKDRKRLQWLILAFAGSGSFLAAWGGPWVMWVAFTSAIVSSLVGWEELRGLDVKISNYSHVVLELNIVRDQWMMLSEDARTPAAASKMARETEKVLWNQNVEFVNAMRKALADAEGDEDELIQHVIEEAKEATAQIKETLYTEVEELIDESIGEAVETVEESIEAATDGSLHQMFTDMRAIDEAELARAENAAEDIDKVSVDKVSVVEDFVDEYFGDDAPGDDVPEDFVDEDFSDTDVDVDFVDEVWVDD
ncbi:MAG: hypothetical protein B6243_04100 [Anaerolineaceae bacterium 4572_5.2]|nr:MAG: hypothetical protein B6243_04100 [Anaerolineaceae bacterium 4572_5.2]